MSERYLENHIVTAAANPLRWLTHKVSDHPDLGHLFGYGLHSYVEPLVRHRVRGINRHDNVTTWQEFAAASDFARTAYESVFPEPVNGVITVETEDLEHYHRVHRHATEALLYAARASVLVCVSESATQLFSPDPQDPSKHVLGVRLKAHSATQVAPAVVTSGGQVVPLNLGVGSWQEPIPGSEWYRHHPELSLVKP